MYLNVFYFNVYLIFLIWIGTSLIANIVRCFVGPFGPLMPDTSYQTPPLMSVQGCWLTRAAIHLCGWSISCIRAADVRLVAGPPWSLVVEVDGLGGGRRGRDSVEKSSELAKKRDINTNSYAVFNLLPFAPAGKKTPLSWGGRELSSTGSSVWGHRNNTITYHLSSLLSKSHDTTRDTDRKPML